MRIPRAPRRRGMTLVEVMIVTVMIAIMATAMSSLIIAVQRGYASYEASSGIQVAGQQAVNRIQRNLIQSKRLFDRTSDPAWLAAAQSGGAPTGGPALLTASALPVIEPNGSFGPTSAGFVQSAVGNALFFLSLDSPVSMTVANSAGSPTSVLVDVYHFNLYYLAYNGGPRVVGFAGAAPIMLQEWHSASFADYDELANLGDGVLTQNAAAYLATHGYPYAVDTATATAAWGFYNLSAGGNFSLQATPKIPLGSTQPMLNILTGISGYGYRYGVAPNTSATFALPYSVPVFAAAGAGTPFPGGFETMVIGANSARQVFMRLVLVAGGAFTGYKTNQQTATATVRDLY